MEIENEIYNYIQQNPASVKVISNQFNIPIRMARYHIYKLKKSGRLREKLDFKDMRRITYVTGKINVRVQ